MGILISGEKDQKETHTVIVDENMTDYSKDPTFIKRAEEAAELLKKYPFPLKFRKKVARI